MTIPFFRTRGRRVFMWSTTPLALLFPSARIFPYPGVLSGDRAGGGMST